MEGKGLLITFEGGEATGKSTQARRLRDRLLRSGVTAVLVQEPGTTPLGRRLRSMLKFTREELSPPAELFLFLAARAQLVAQVVRPALERGEVIVADRFTDSTLAYQGFGRGLEVARLRPLNDLATGGLKPHLTVLLDLPLEQALRCRGAEVRRAPGPRRHERFEREVTAFHHRVREGYLAMAQEEPQRWLVVDATLPRKQIAEIVWKRVLSLLEQL